MKDSVPPFDLLKKNYPKPTEISREDLYRSIGWDEYIDKAGFENTCALRMSLCLIGSGMVFAKGEFRVLKGDKKGQRVWTSRAHLTAYLETLWGAPTFQVSSAAEAQAQIGDGAGVISFGPLPAYAGGHIDIIDGYFDVFKVIWSLGSQSNAYVCGSDCHWDAQDFKFWKAAE